MADEIERQRRRIAEAENVRLEQEVERLSDERERLARKLEYLTALLYELRAQSELDETTQQRIEDALAFDGRFVAEANETSSEFDLVPDEEIPPGD